VAPRGLAAPQHLTPGRHLYPGLVLARSLHAFEDYVFGFHESFPLYSLAPEFFVLLQLGLVLLLAGLIPSVAHGRRWALRAARFWAIVEVVNGAAHLMLGLITWGYYPGLWTAPLLLVFGVALGRSLRT
jgi:hypothetical protein